ncbi:MAG: GAF domain-containing protein [Candidatus Eisenbacteria bacterium]|uniref:histidine kinase n=1 Tax=Eiseniibacteriota bacterium TaxID=2212470 RepID=A0A9D6QNJ4_UNCEI|nr:GAF domain-containing protein [Candidatus Eisenbacteria bacterium]MBI3539004.1 GAF domain-containing protein [Candidatus Eisenbacteria bacterium]
MTVTNGARTDDRHDLAGEGLAMLAQAVLALRSTGDLGTACGIACACAVNALEAADSRLLRVDPRSGALRLIEDSGVETPYLPEHGGPVECAMRSETPRFDDGLDPQAPRETLLWLAAPAALATLPLASGSTVQGFLLVAFPHVRRFGAAERLFLQTLADALAMALERFELRAMLSEEHERIAELERRLSAGEEASTSLMSVVAHEIRTPLTAIKAYTETLLDSLANPHTPRERFLGIINDECDRLTRLVTDILDLSRLEAGQRPLRLSRFDLARVSREVADALGAVARPRQIEVEIAIDPGLVVEADTDLLRRLIHNLLGNAIKFSPVGGRVRVTAETQGEEWSGAVEDQGSGIPPEDLPRVFERFFRARQPGEQQVEGTGLGLAIARGIVELHGGRIWAESLPGGGSRFRFVMPMRQMASAAARRIARQITLRPDLRELFDRTVEMVGVAMDAGIVSLMMVDPDRGDLFITASRGLEGQNLTDRRITVRSGVAGSVAAWGRPVLVNNIETDRRFLRLNHPQYSTKSLLSVPLRVEGEVLGVLNVNNKASGTPFDDHDLSLMTALVERIGSAVERTYAYPDSGRAVEEALEAVRSLTRLRRDYLLGTRNVVRLARATGRELGMSSADVDVLGYVAAIHDLGMTRIQDRVFHEARPLLEDERQQMIQHPEVSVEIIRPLEYLGSVRDLILTHHEHWDGSGYPRGLAGESIPLGGRVLAVVDAYESMTSGRPYRPPRSRQHAIEELERESGRQFDPQAVAALVRVLGREGSEA